MFGIAVDDGHLAWHAGIQQEINTVDNVLRWLRQRKLELLTPSPLLRGHRPRSASSAAPAASVKTVRRHRRGQSEPAPDSYPMESNTALNSSPCSHHSTESKNLIPHPQFPNGATETPAPEDQSTFPPLEDGANTAIPPSTTPDTGLQLHVLTPQGVELDNGDPPSLERSLADVDDQRRNLQGTASALHDSEAYAKARLLEMPSAERDESPMQDARLSVPTGVLNPAFSFPPAPVPEASETPVPRVAKLKEEYLAVEASQTNEGQRRESLHDSLAQSESIPLEEHPLDGGKPQLSDSESPVVATAPSASELPHSDQEAHQDLHGLTSPVTECEGDAALSSTQPFTNNEEQRLEPHNTSPLPTHDHPSTMPHQQRAPSDKTLVELGESLMSFSGLNTSAVAGAIATAVVGAAWLLRSECLLSFEKLQC